jgi:hypothetical protein
MPQYLIMEFTGFETKVTNFLPESISQQSQNASVFAPLLVAQPQKSPSYYMYRERKKQQSHLYAAKQILTLTNCNFLKFPTTTSGEKEKFH